MADITIAEVREKYPDYNDLSDEQLADKLHTAHYSDMPKEQFYKKVGLNSKIDKIESKEGEQSWQSKLPRNLLAGFSEMGQNALDVPSNFAKAMEKRYGQNTLAGKLGLKAQDIPRQDYNYPEMLGLPKNPTTADKLIRGLAGQVPALLAPELKLGRVGEALKSIPFAGRFAKKAIGTAIPVGGFEATQNQENPLEAGAKGGATTIPFSLASSIATSMNPYARVAGRLGLTGLGAYGGYEGAKAIGANSLLAEIPAAAAGAALGMVGRNPKVEARESMLKGVSETSYKEKLEAAQRLGLKYLTPAEASGNPFVAAQQGAAGKTEAGSKLLYEKGKERLESEKAAIDKLKYSVNSSSSDASYAIREAAKEHIEELKSIRSNEASPFYKEAEDKEIPQHELDSLLETPRIKNTFFHILKDEDYNEYLQAKKPTGRKMIAMIENRIDNLIDKARSKPYNSERVQQLEFAKKNLVDDYENPEVQHVLDEIRKSDPIFHAVSQGINPRSVKFLDLVKKKINTDTENLSSKLNPDGKDLFKAGLIGSAAKKITEVADKYIEPYKKARNTFEDMSPIVKEAENSSLGTLSKLKDEQLKNASKIIFDPAQTDIRSFSNIKKAIMRKNPDAWNSIVRTEMERLTQKGDSRGTNFYKKILENPTLYNKFKLALDHNPEALQQLEDAKLIFGDLISPPTVRTAAGLANTGMRQERNSRIAFANYMKDKLSGGKFDKAAIELITNPKWADELHKVAQVGKFRKGAGKIIDLLGRVSGASVASKVPNKPTVLELDKFKGYE